MASIYNISFDLPFLPTVSDMLIKNAKQQGNFLESYTILVNNARVIKALNFQFLQYASKQAIVLPKIVSIDDLQNNIFYEIIKHKDLMKIYSNFLSKKIITKAQRSFVLLKLIQQKDPNISTSMAFKLADYLGTFIDESYYEEVDLNKLETVLDDNLSKYWQDILKFLQIITVFWPKYLEQNNAIDQANINLLYIKIYSQLLNRQQFLKTNNTKFVALNITSNYPAINSLLETIYNFDSSQLFFFGIDLNLYKKNNNGILNLQDIEIKNTHPQFLTYKTLSAIKANIDSIVDIQLNNNVKSNIINSLWHNSINTNFNKQDVINFANNISILTAQNEEEEAKSIALVVKKYLQDAQEDKSISIGIICNNKNLIKRINLELSKWSVEVNNYLGENLIDFKNAEFFLLISNVLENNFSKTTFLSLLKHKYFNIKSSFSKTEIAEIINFLDEHIFRLTFVNYGIDEYISKIQEEAKQYNEKTKTYKSYSKLLLHKAETFLQEIKLIFSQIFVEVNNLKIKNFSNFLLKHIKVAESISLLQEDDNESVLWQNQEGKDLSEVLALALQDAENLGSVDIINYNLILKYIISLKSVYYTNNKSKRVFLYGGLQSVLMNHKVVIFANFNDTAFPNVASDNPFFNKYILKSIGFNNLDINISKQANLLCQVLGAQKIVITRANKNITGQSQTPSRWLIKLQTFLKYYISEDFYNFFQVSKNINLNTQNFANILDETFLIDFSNVKIINKAVGEANLQQFPKQISITALETLNRNPYSFFIDKVLKINPLQEIDQNINKAEIGSLIHESLEEFFKQINIKNILQNLDKSKQQLIDIAYKKMQYLFNDISFKIFKWHLIIYQLNTVFDFLYDKIKDPNSKLFLEEAGNFVLNVKSQEIKITGIADNILYNSLNNTATIFDYKTTVDNKYKKYFLQLPLLSYMLLHNCFNNIKNLNINEVNASYLFLPKNFATSLKSVELKDHLINTLKVNNHHETILNFDNNIKELLNNYIVNDINFVFDTDNINNIFDDHKYFSRFYEWNQNLDLLNDDNEEDEVDEEGEVEQWS